MVDGFSLVFMAKRGKGNLKRSLLEEDNSGSKKGVASLNRGKGQEITGVTIPEEGTLKGWEFGEGVRMACCNVNNQLYAIQADCPRCGFDLWKGTLIAKDPAWDDLPRVACPTCSTTYSMRTGKHGPPIKRSGLQGFVSGLAKQATSTDAMKDAQVFRITRDEEDGRVFCRF